MITEIPIPDARADEYFLDTLDDLRRLTRYRSNAYDVAQLAGIIRRLLFDSQPLWTLVNRDRRLKIEYVVAGIRQYRQVGEVGDDRAWFSGFHMLPELIEVNNFKDAPIHRFDFKKFAKMPVAAAGWDDDQPSQVITVQELVKHFAHKEGGVHYDGEAADNALLARLMKSDRRAMELTLLALGRIVLHAMEPLAYKIMIDHSGWLDPHRSSGKLQVDGTLYHLARSVIIPNQGA